MRTYESLIDNHSGFVSLPYEHLSMHIDIQFPQQRPNSHIHMQIIPGNSIALFLHKSQRQRSLADKIPVIRHKPAAALVLEAQIEAHLQTHKLIFLLACLLPSLSHRSYITSAAGVSICSCTCGYRNYLPGVLCVCMFARGLTGLMTIWRACRNTPAMRTGTKKHTRLITSDR